MDGIMSAALEPTTQSWLQKAAWPPYGHCVNTYTAKEMLILVNSVKYDYHTIQTQTPSYFSAISAHHHNNNT